jgi:hypothetical protein
MVTGVELITSDQALQSFPNITSVLLGAVISGCWNDEFVSMNDVRQKIREKTCFLGKLSILLH